MANQGDESFQPLNQLQEEERRQLRRDLAIIIDRAAAGAAEMDGLQEVAAELTEQNEHLRLQLAISEAAAAAGKSTIVRLLKLLGEKQKEIEMPKQKGSSGEQVEEGRESEDMEWNAAANAQETEEIQVEDEGENSENGEKLGDEEKKKVKKNKKGSKETHSKERKWAMKCPICKIFGSNCVIGFDLHLRNVHETTPTKLTYNDMPQIMIALGLPLYWKKPVWDQVAHGRSRVELKDFLAWWWNLTTIAHDSDRFVHVLSHGSRSYLVEDDFHSLVLDLIHSHPGLDLFCKSEKFHESFIQVIVTRIFWSVNRSWDGEITADELGNSKLLENIRELKRTEDVNQLTDFFSYKHFCVVYCNFWEIDSDHDMEITKEDLLKYSEHAILPLVVDRIFSGAVTRGQNTANRATLDLSAFTAFLLAYEDKNHPTSIEYWFRVLDLDGDGRISLKEMETFYNQLVKAIGQFGIDSMTFYDLANYLIGMIEPESGRDFTLADLKRSKMAGRFFNAFVNWRKFYEQESSEGEKTSVKGTGDEELSDWDRFCMEEYKQMMEADEDNDENAMR